MDGAEWKTVEDLFLSFFRVVETPAWHGRNFTAVRDSTRGGQINNIEVPYRLVFKNYDRVNTSVNDEADHFVEIIQELSGQGFPWTFALRTQSDAAPLYS